MSRSREKKLLKLRRWFPPLTRPSTAPAWKLRSRFWQKTFPFLPHSRPRPHSQSPDSPTRLSQHPATAPLTVVRSSRFLPPPHSACPQRECSPTLSRFARRLISHCLELEATRKGSSAASPSSKLPSLTCPPLSASFLSLGRSPRLLPPPRLPPPTSSSPPPCTSCIAPNPRSGHRLSLPP